MTKIVIHATNDSIKQTVEILQREIKTRELLGLDTEGLDLIITSIQAQKAINSNIFPAYYWNNYTS